MTLQNKKMGLLSNDAVVSDTPDLFDQYGSDDSSDDFVIPQQTAVPTDHDITRPKKDDDEKAWEQEYEEDQPAQAPPIATTVVQPVNQAPAQQQTVARPPKDADKNDESVETVEQKDESLEAVQIVKEEKSTIKEIPKEKEKIEEPVAKPIAKKSIPKPKLDKPTKEIKIDPSKKTIMLVDDDIDTLEMYSDVFENSDYNVIRAADGLEALSIMSEHTPHVIFTGIVMPRMDGFTMMESLNQNKRTADIPVVINSHLGRETDKEKAEELGARDFIIRGFTQPREVVERIGALLLKNEYVFNFDKNDKDVRQLVKDLGNPNFLHCPHGQKMAIKLKIEDERELTFTARFSCIDEEKK